MTDQTLEDWLLKNVQIDSNACPKFMFMNIAMHIYNEYSINLGMILCKN